MMNQFTGIGRLTADPKVSQANEHTVARFTLAIDRPKTKDGEQGADFISCVAFGKTAEFLEKYVTKGTKLAITGRIQTGSFTNKDGQKVFTTDVVVERTEFCESKGSANAQPSQQKDVATAIDADMPFGNDDEIPFR